MDSRGYARAGTTPRPVRLATAALVVGGLLGVCAGVYGLLDATTPRALGLPMLAAGGAVAAAGMLLGGRRLTRRQYRPDPWRLPETLTALAGIGAGALLFATATVDPANLYPSLSPLTWPQLTPLPALAVALAAAPAWLTPPVPTETVEVPA